MKGNLIKREKILQHEGQCIPPILTSTKREATPKRKMAKNVLSSNDILNNALRYSESPWSPMANPKFPNQLL
uniref:Uncharacterized protein n=1 Tax=Manihot esculenta TaxID=3983 RepID=A0A2C9V9I5_MANES